MSRNCQRLELLGNPAWKLELLSPQNRYIDHQCGIWKIMDKAIFFVKGSVLILVPFKAWEAIEAGKKLLFFLNKCKLFFFAKLNFLKDSYTTALYLLDLSDFYLHLVYFIMKIYPVTKEWEEADWLDPFLTYSQENYLVRKILWQKRSKKSNQ